MLHWFRTSPFVTSRMSPFMEALITALHDNGIFTLRQFDICFPGRACTYKVAPAARATGLCSQFSAPSIANLGAHGCTPAASDPHCILAAWHAHA